MTGESATGDSPTGDVGQPRRRGVPIVIGGLALCVTVLAGCSGSDEAAPVPSDAARSTPPASSIVPDPTTTLPTSSTTTMATVPDTGVPGLDSADAFCRSWSEFAGSFQALSLASSLGDRADAYRSEVAASGTVAGAFDGLGASLPDELSTERDLFLGELLGPFASRARRAQAALQAAGITAAQSQALDAAWLAALTSSGTDTPDLVVAVPPDSQSAVDAAVTAFAGDVPPIASDPDLVTDADAPRTLAYIAANCPDQGTLGGNDVVD